LDSGRSRVFSCFCVIVVEIWGTVFLLATYCDGGVEGDLQSIFWARHDCYVVLPEQMSPSHLIDKMGRLKVISEPLRILLRHLPEFLQCHVVASLDFFIVAFFSADNSPRIWGKNTSRLAPYPTQHQQISTTCKTHNKVSQNVDSPTYRLLGHGRRVCIPDPCHR
jgi:hypothetical protein